MFNSLQWLIYHKTKQRECPCGETVKMMDCRIVVSSNSIRTITFTFRQIPLGKV